MWADSIVTYFHFLSIIGLFVVLFIEAILLKPNMAKGALKLLGKIDGYYGLLSVLVLLSGGLRLFYFGKGASYYLGNSAFLIKLGLFVVVGLLSIYPSVRFFKMRNNKNEIVKIRNYSVLKKLIVAELLILILIPFLAVLMANGYDFFN